LKRKLQFLGAALPPPAPAPAAPAASAAPAAPTAPAASPPPPAPAPAAAGAPAPAPAPSHAVKGDAAPRKAARKRKSRTRARTRRSTAAAPAPRATTGSAHKRRRGGAGKRRVLHDAPLFRGVPESHTASGARSADAKAGYTSVNALSPPAVLSASVSDASADWPSPTDAVPLALALGALLLTGTVLARRRRLGSDPGGRRVRRGPDADS
jgi:hypothetical protein